MFTPNTPAMLRRMNGRDEFGIQTFDTPVPIRIAIVDFNDSAVTSAVRADRSASRGSAEIETITAKFLVPKTVSIKKSDVIDVDGLSIEVAGVQLRRNVLGQVDHQEVTGDLWPGGA